MTTAEDEYDALRTLMGKIAANTSQGQAFVGRSWIKARQVSQSAELSVSRKVPQGILKRANKLWHREHKNEFYGTSYMAADPWSDVDQQLGLLTCLANGKHMMKYINTVRKRQLKLKKPVGSSTPSASTPVDAPIIDESITRQTPHVNPFVATDLYLNLSGISDGDEACDEENLSSSSDNLGAPALLA